jgi:hypothetical protein
MTSHAYHYNNGLPVVVTLLQEKVLTGLCIETAVLLLSCVHCRKMFMELLPRNSESHLLL